MGAGLEIVNAYVAAAATTNPQAMTPGAGQSFTVRASSPTGTVNLEGVWGNTTVISDIRIRSPRLHDDVQAIRATVQANDPRPSILEYFTQTLYSQDFLTVEDVPFVAPGAAALQGAGLLVYYSDIPGVSANLRTWAEVAPNVVAWYSQRVLPVTGATAGDWGPGVAINSSYDVLKANTLYAILGYEIQTACTSIAIQGIDTGNLLCGGPGCVDPITTRRWFAWQSDEAGYPLIPVINSANKGATLVNACGLVASTAIPVTLYLAQLSA